MLKLTRGAPLHARVDDFEKLRCLVVRLHCYTLQQIQAQPPSSAILILQPATRTEPPSRSAQAVSSRYSYWNHQHVLVPSALLPAALRCSGPRGEPLVRSHHWNDLIFKILGCVALCPVASIVFCANLCATARAVGRVGLFVSTASHKTGVRFEIKATRVLSVCRPKGFLCLLLDSDGCRSAIHGPRTAPLAFLLRRRPVVSAVVVILIDIHLPRRRLIDWRRLRWRRWRRTVFLLRRRRHARGLMGDRLHGGQRRQMMRSFRRMVRGCRSHVLHAPHIRRAAVWRCTHLLNW